MLDLPQGARRRARLFCRAALLYTGSLGHQVCLRRLHAMYAAAERRRGSLPLPRRAFTHAVAATFPAALITPTQANRPRQVVGVCPSQCPIWYTHAPPR